MDNMTDEIDFMTDGDAMQYGIPVNPNVSMSWIRRQLGDSPVSALRIISTTINADERGKNGRIFARIEPSQAVEVSRLFPDAVWTDSVTVVTGGLPGAVVT